MLATCERADSCGPPDLTRPFTLAPGRGQPKVGENPGLAGAETREILAFFSGMAKQAPPRPMAAQARVTGWKA
jgi:hypothetical protein